MSAKKVIAQIFNVISMILIVVEVAVIVGLIFFRPSNKMTSVFGYGLSYVITGSMEPEIKTGSLILSKVYKGGTLKKDDVITYQGDGKTITHKIISVNGDTIVTKGVANSVADAPITRDKVISKYVCTLTFFGALFRILKQSLGFMLIVVLPMMIIICYEVISTVIQAKLQNGDEEDDDQK